MQKSSTPWEAKYSLTHLSIYIYRMNCFQVQLHLLQAPSKPLRRPWCAPWLLFLGSVLMGVVIFRVDLATTLMLHCWGA